MAYKILMRDTLQDKKKKPVSRFNYEFICLPVMSNLIAVGELIFEKQSKMQFAQNRCFFIVLAYAIPFNSFV